MALTGMLYIRSQPRFRSVACFHCLESNMATAIPDLAIIFTCRPVDSQLFSYYHSATSQAMTWFTVGYLIVHLYCSIDEKLGVNQRNCSTRVKRDETRGS